MRMKTETMKMANGGAVDKMKKKVKDTLKKLKPRPTGRPEKVKDFFKKKNKDKIKDKVKQKLKEKKKSKPTKTGLLSKAGIAPVSAPGGIPKVQSQKTAQKDPPKKDIPGKRVDRPDFKPKPMPMPMPRPNPGTPRPMPMPMPRPRQLDEFKRIMDEMPKNPKRLTLMKDGGELKKMFAGKALKRAAKKMKKMI